MWYGEKRRVRLNDDLRRYHAHLAPGTQGTLLPNVQVGMWGAQDRFGAVRFDCCGHTLDVLLAGLDIEGQAEETAAREARLREDLRTSQAVVLRLGPRGGFRSLSLMYTDSKLGPVSIGYGGREKGEWVLEILREHGIPVKEIREPR